MADNGTDAAAAEAVRGAEAGRVRAILAGDVATLAAMTAPGYRHIETGGSQRDRDGFLAAMSRPGHRFLQWVIEESDVQVHGDAAVVTGRYHNQAQGPDGPGPVKHALFTRVWIRGADGEWRNVAHQATACPPR